MRTYDLTEYLTARLRLDTGRAHPGDAERVEILERKLPVPFAACIPHLGTFAPGPGPYPRNLTADDIRVVFLLRNEHALLGTLRETLHGTDLPDPPATGDWLDFFETEREATLSHREKLRKMDSRIHGIFTGTRTNPGVDADEIDARLANDAAAATGR